MVVKYMMRILPWAFIMFIVNLKLKMIVVGLFFIVLTACASKQQSMDSIGCYEIEGDTVVYVCRDFSPENPKANTGYDGPYNPKALDLFRPGRLENINVW